MGQVFSYSTEELACLERTLSRERLGPYLAASSGDFAAAIRLYERNGILSAAFYSPLQGLEVALRNTIDQRLAAGRGPEWIVALERENCFLEPERRQVAKARETLLRQGKEVSPGRMVAELSFGFWTALLGTHYAKPIWDRHLQGFFVGRRRSDTSFRLQQIRKLRNRIAHHEPILARDLAADYGRIVETIGWLCPVTAAWIDRAASFRARWETP